MASMGLDHTLGALSYAWRTACLECACESRCFKGKMLGLSKLRRDAKEWGCLPFCMLWSSSVQRLGADSRFSVWLWAQC